MSRWRRDSWDWVGAQRKREGPWRTEGGGQREDNKGGGTEQGSRGARQGIERGGGQREDRGG